MPRKTRVNPDETILHVYLPNAEFDALTNLRGPRSWRSFFWGITEDARKAAETNQELRGQIDHLEERLRRAEHA